MSKYKLNALESDSFEVNRKNQKHTFWYVWAVRMVGRLTSCFLKSGHFKMLTKAQFNCKIR